jgi:hypothetical protein
MAPPQGIHPAAAVEPLDECELSTAYVPDA